MSWVSPPFLLIVLLMFTGAEAQAQRRVTFRAEDGAPLSAAYYEASQRPAPGIVLLPMWRRSHADWDFAASQLAEAGFAVLALDYRAAEDSGVVSIALLSPGIDYKGLRTEAAMKKFGSRPALLAGSTRDPYSARTIRHLTTIGRGLREVRLTDAVAHGTVLVARDAELMPALVDWFKRTLL